MKNGITVLTAVQKWKVRDNMDWVYEKLNELVKNGEIPRKKQGENIKNLKKHR